MIEENYIETEYGKFCYLECGEGEKTIVMLHGGMGQPGGVNYLAQYFRDKKYRIIAPYLPGHGDSFSLAKDFSFSDLVRTVGDLLDSLDVYNATLMGHSMGGALSWELSLIKRERIEKIVLSDPLLKPIEKSMVEMGFYIANDKLRDKFAARRDKKNEYQLNSSHKIKSPQLLYVKRFWNMICDTFYLTVKPNEITQPVLIFWGKDDSAVSLKDAEDLISQLPRKKVIEISGGHYWYYAHRLEFLKAVETFIGD